MPPSSTSFRRWMDHLIAPRGGEREWPWLLREMLIEEYLRQRELGFAYAGDVFKDRDNDDPTAAVLAEKRAVKELFHHCHQESAGVLTIGETRYWLLGWEWPNQASERGRRADLIGLNVLGGLVVFECKLDNNHGPIAAALEGLDYLSCLTSVSNFGKIVEGFTKWVAKPGRVRPQGFEASVPSRDSRHEVVVLASAEYCGRYRRSDRGRGWEELLALPPSPSVALDIRFAETDFQSPVARWVTT